MACISRRRALARTGLVALLACPPVLTAARSKTRLDPVSLHTALRRFLADVDLGTLPWDHLGPGCWPPACRSACGLRRLVDWPGLVGGDWHSYLHRRRSADFELDRVVVVDGWVLSETEALACAELAAFEAES